MRLTALIPVRNEAWILGFSARVALQWCDDVIILLHSCTDQSERIAGELASEFAGRVHLLKTDDPDWSEMQHRQLMLEHARQIGSTHIAIVDADEVLTANLLECRASIERMNTGEILQLPGYNLRGGMTQYHSNGIWGNRWFSCVFRDYPNLSWSGDKFHSREPQGISLRPWRPIQQKQGGILHFWGASERRLIAKHRAYRITETLRWPNKPRAAIEQMYSLATHGQPGHPSFGTPATWTYAPVPSEWIAPYAYLMKYLSLEAEPWQEKWVAEMIAKHGVERFAGLSV